MKLYKFDIRNLAAQEYSKWYSLMSSDKQSRVDGFKFEDDKKRTVAADMLAKKAISENFGVDAKNVRIFQTESGKPYVDIDGCFFSISHSENLVVCVISAKPVGVDAELVRPVNIDISKRVCNNSEIEYIQEDFCRFFEVWTAKEAYIKAKGSGFSDHNVNTLQLEKQTVRFEDYIISIVEL